MGALHIAGLGVNPSGIHIVYNNIDKKRQEISVWSYVYHLPTVVYGKNVPYIGLYYSLRM